MAGHGSGGDLTPLEKHAAFFDRNNDGVIYPWETYQGFRAIGCGIPLSLFAAAFINGFLSLKTKIIFSSMASASPSDRPSTTVFSAPSEAGGTSSARRGIKRVVSRKAKVFVDRTSSHSGGVNAGTGTIGGVNAGSGGVNPGTNTMADAAPSRQAGTGKEDAAPTSSRVDVDADASRQAGTGKEDAAPTSSRVDVDADAPIGGGLPDACIGKGAGDCSKGKGVDNAPSRQAGDETRVGLDEIVVKGKLYTRMSPFGLKKLIGQLTECQKSDVEEIGFGGILHLNTDEIPSDLCFWLVEQFESFRCCLKVGNGIMRIGEDDVYAVMGLPKGPKVVLEAPRNKKDVQYDVFLREWKSSFGGAEVTNNMLVKKLLALVDGGDEFKRDFVVFVVSSIIKGNHNAKVYHRVLKSLVDVNEIKSFNWCKFTIDSLCSASEKWKKKKVSYFNGPILFLLMCYLDRVLLRSRSVAREFPILRSWTRELIFSRVRDEKEIGGFGLGRIEKTFIKEGMRVEKKTSGETIDSSKEETMDDKALIRTVAEVATSVVSSFSKFTKVISVARQRFPNFEAIKKMESLVSSVLQGSEGFSSFEGSKGKEAASEGASFSDEDEIYKNPSFWHAVDQLEKTFKKPVHQSTPNFDLGISLSGDDDHHADENLNAASSAHASPASQTHAAVQTPAAQTHSSPASQSRAAAQTPAGQTHSSPASHSSPATKDFLVASRTRSSASPIQREVDVAVDVEQRTKLKRKAVAESSKKERREMPKRNKGLPPSFKSPFCIRHIDVLKALTSSEKLLCDWAFCRFDGDRERDPKKREIAYQDDHFSVNRHVFQSLSYDVEVSIQMIDLWSHILNLDEERRDAASVPRFFLSVITPELLEPKFYSDFKAMAKRDIDISNHLDICLAKLVFIPISIQVSRYVFLVCINFNTSTVDIIDIMKNPPHVELYANIAKKLVKTISKFLKEIGSVNYNTLLKFNVKYIEMPWRYDSGDFSPHDIGIYCMRHMETYRGNTKEFDIGFRKPHNIFGKKLRAKYAASILSSKSNVLRVYIKLKAEELSKS